MALYDFQCDICGRVAELRRPMADHDKPEPCGTTIESQKTYDSGMVRLFMSESPTAASAPVRVTTEHNCLGVMYRVGIELTARMPNQWKG